MPEQLKTRLARGSPIERAATSSVPRWRGRRPACPVRAASWYRTRRPSHLVDGPHGQQRLVDLEAVVARAAQAGDRVGRRRQTETIELLLDRIDELERRLEALEQRS